jgi:hypothetical protein
VVHISGEMKTDEIAKDTELNFTPDQRCLILRRNVEIYHWKEEKEESKNSTTYKYKLVWTQNDIDSSKFKQRHENPPRAVDLHSKTFHAETHIGAYRLSMPCMHRLKRWHVSELTADTAQALAPVLTNPPPGMSFLGLRDGVRITRVEGQVVHTSDSAKKRNSFTLQCFSCCRSCCCCLFLSLSRSLVF